MDADRREESTVAHFDARAAHYDASGAQRMFHGLHRSTLDWLAELAPRPAALLDVGCGTGAMLRTAAGRLPGTRLVGVDPARRMLGVARRSLPPGAALACAGVDRLPFADAAFDAVTTTMSFHFWTRPEAGLREVRRVLAPGGTLIVADLFATGWLRPVAPMFGGGFNPRTRPAMVRLLRAAGLAPVGWRTAWRAGPLPVLHAVAAAAQ